MTYNRNSTVHLFAGKELDEALLIAPETFRVESKLSPENLAAAVSEWITGK